MRKEKIFVTGGCLCGELRYEATAAPFNATDGFDEFPSLLIFQALGLQLTS